MLKLTSLVTPSALLAAFSLAAAPAMAQQKYHGRENSSGQPSSAQPAQPSDGQSRERAQPRGEAPARTEAPRQQAEAPRPQAGAAPGVGIQQQAAPRTESRGNNNRGNDNRGNDNRANDNRRADNRRDDSRRDDSRGNDNRRYESGRAIPRGNVYAPHYEPQYSPRSSTRDTPRGYGYYGSHSYYRPYVFRPRFSIGFGIYAGYPVPYTYSYPYPVVVYGYRAPRERVMITPGSAYYGGVALEMTPYDADVFVDGEYAGRVEDFDGSDQPLTLASGLHHVEVQARGYEPLVFNVEIQPGQVVPYRGTMQPQ